MIEAIEYIKFKTLEDKQDKLREWGLISPKAKGMKKFIYKGVYTDKPIECEIVGYITSDYLRNYVTNMVVKQYETVVIKIGCETHKISIDYLKDMQDGQRRNFHEMLKQKI